MNQQAESAERLTPLQQGRLEGQNTDVQAKELRNEEMTMPIADAYRAKTAAPDALLAAHHVAREYCDALAQAGYDTYRLATSIELKAHFCVDGCVYFAVASLQLTAGQQVSPNLAIRVDVTAEVTESRSVPGAVPEVQDREVVVALVHTHTGDVKRGARLATGYELASVNRVAKELLADHLYEAGLRSLPYRNDPNVPEHLCDWGLHLGQPRFEHQLGESPCHRLLERHWEIPKRQSQSGSNMPIADIAVEDDFDI